MNKKEPILWFDSSKQMGIQPCINYTYYVKAEKLILQDKTLGFEIDLKERIEAIDKLVINGITFIKEK